MRQKRATGLAMLALTLFAAGCSDLHLVSNTTSAYIVAEQQYEWECVEVKGPETCAARQTELKEAKRQTELANKAYKVGKLPKPFKKKLKAIAKSMGAK
jgi:hypothetical protein